MKKAFKWLAWGIAGLIGLVLFLEAEKSTQQVFGAIIFVCYLFWTVEQAAVERQKQVIYRLDKIRSHLEELRNHPLNTAYITEGIEGLVEEHRLRQRASDNDPHSP